MPPMVYLRFVLVGLAAVVVVFAIPPLLAIGTLFFWYGLRYGFGNILVRELKWHAQTSSPVFWILVATVFASGFVVELRRKR